MDVMRFEDTRETEKVRNKEKGFKRKETEIIHVEKSGMMSTIESEGTYGREKTRNKKEN